MHPGGFHKLSLLNGWTASPFSTAAPAAILANGVVTLRGAVASGTTSVILTQPRPCAPANTVWVAVDLCNATNGQLVISTNGTVNVEAEGGTFADAQCFTSLEGASFVQTPVGATSLSLINGWTGGAFGAGAGAVEDELGYVHLSGAISSTGSSLLPFVLPPELPTGQAGLRSR